MHEVNQQLKALEPLLTSLRERLAASEKVHAEWLRWLHREVNTHRKQLVALASRPEEMDWESTETKAIEPPNLKPVIERRITQGIYTKAFAPAGAPPVPWTI